MLRCYCLLRGPPNPLSLHVCVWGGGRGVPLIHSACMCGCGGIFWRGGIFDPSTHLLDGPLTPPSPLCRLLNNQAEALEDMEAAMHISMSHLATRTVLGCIHTKKKKYTTVCVHACG